MSKTRRITIAGAGLAGALLAVLLCRRGHDVEVFERRGDPRVRGFLGGRSINLALAERGLAALREAELADAVLAQAIVMRGRMVHFAEGGEQLQPYGLTEDEVIRSVHRARLNLLLLDAAQRAGARIHFEQGLESVDWSQRLMTLRDADGIDRSHAFEHVIGCDGAGSRIRAELAREVELGVRIEPLGHGYKELEIPPDAQGGFRLEPNALHIWPRGSFMCIALPNTERTFTVTLFLRHEGDHPSFASVRDAAGARAFFDEYFSGMRALVPDLEHDFTHNPTGELITTRLERWQLDRRAVLLGDAAHPMVPFHGQGMNCAFEDCVALDRALADEGDVGDAFARFFTERHANADAIQTMAVENYYEMRDRVDDADYLLQRALERLLAQRHPGRFVPRYSMVSFTRLPYALAFERGRVQRALLEAACRGKQRIEEIDLAAVDRDVERLITPLG